MIWNQAKLRKTSSGLRKWAYNISISYFFYFLKASYYIDTDRNMSLTNNFEYDNYEIHYRSI